MKHFPNLLSLSYFNLGCETKPRLQQKNVLMGGNWYWIHFVVVVIACLLINALGSNYLLNQNIPTLSMNLWIMKLRKIQFLFHIKRVLRNFLGNIWRCKKRLKIIFYTEVEVFLIKFSYKSLRFSSIHSSHNMHHMFVIQ